MAGPSESGDSPDLKTQPLEGVVEATLNGTSGGERIDLGEILETFGGRSFGPVLIVLGVIVVSPIGSIPGLPIVLGPMVILFAAQLGLGRDYPWIPHRFTKVSVERRQVERIRDRGRRWLRMIDFLVAERLTLFTGKIGQRLTALACVIHALLMIPLEVVPFAVTLPGSALILFGLAVTGRDGFFMLLGHGATIATFYLSYNWLLGS